MNTSVVHRLPVWGIVCVVMALPTYVVRFSLFGIPTTLLEIILLVVVTVCLLLVGMQRATFVMPLAIWGTLLLCIGAASLLIAPDLRAAAGVYKAYLVEPVLFGILCSITIRSKADVLCVLRALTIPAAIIAVWAIVQYLTGWGIPDPWGDFPGRRSTALYGYPNAVGLFLAPIGAVLAACTIQWKISLRTRVWFAVVCIFCALAIIAARADGAIVALFGAITVTGYFTRYRLLVVATIVLMCTIALTVPASREVLLFQDTSGQVHLALWRGTVQLLLHRPLIGAGLSGFPTVYNEYRESAHVELLQYAHNIFFDFWVELGIAGCIWFMGTLIIGVVMARRAIQHGDIESGVFLYAFFTAFVLYGLVDVPYFKNDLSVLCWTLFAVCFFLYTKSIRSA